MNAISKATKHNWAKLNSDTEGKLTKRANKTRSTRHIVATSYLDYTPAHRLLDNIIRLNYDIEDVMYTLCIDYLRHVNILDKTHVKEFLSTQPCHRIVNIDIPTTTWDSGGDVLGFIYQSLITEGERNLTGQYYTNRQVVEHMLGNNVLKDGETFLDPCCGSGAFLLAVNTDTPSCLYGLDINPIAVMIAGTNLLAKYANHHFTPHVYCLDFLQRHTDQDNLPATFDNIYTNPPWGTDKQNLYKNLYPEIKSKERSSMVIVEALKRLNNKGHLSLLLPTSLLKINSHTNIRKYILSHSTIQAIDLFTHRFDGVFTDFFSIHLSGQPTDIQQYTVATHKRTSYITLSSRDKSLGIIATRQLSDIDESIIHRMDSLQHDSLQHSLWALGIVTGHNKSKVKKEKQPGMEAIYTGRQVSPYTLEKATHYTFYNPDTFQQCAKEELYRADEKLIYRFIARYPIVAYDDRQSLCLNSANILIPQLDGISIKSTAALLNSTLYRYYYTTRFSDIKVLKSYLQQLPFPLLTPQQDTTLSNLVSDIQASQYSEEHKQEIDRIVYSLFGITPSEQAHITAEMM